MMSRTKWPLLPKSGDFVRDILKKSPMNYMLRRSSLTDDFWGCLERNDHFCPKVVISFETSSKKAHKIGLGAPIISPGALQSPPGGVQEASWRAKLVKNQKYTQKLDEMASILASKTEPKTLKNRFPKRDNFRYLLESIFPWILLPKWRPKTPWRTSFFGGNSFIDFWRMSLTKHQLLRFRGTPKLIPKTIKKHQNFSIPQKSKNQWKYGPKSFQKDHQNQKKMT